MNQLFYNIFKAIVAMFPRGIFFADVISVHNGYMKHARSIEFDYMNLLAVL